MCGIFALFMRRPLRDEEIEVARRCRDSLVHRGPDASGEWVDAREGVYLGHRRLSVIDLSDASNQPFTRDGRSLSFNGEIYNYRELRKNLESKGVRFFTTGDTETLFAALATMGTSAIEKLDGMFALTYWDGNEATVASDPFGEKPLYTARLPEGIAVASEIGALLPFANAVDGFSDEDWAAFLSLGYFPGPRTAFSNISKFPPASIAKISNGEIAQLDKYWTPTVGRPRTGRIAPVEKSDLVRVRDCLAESLERRLISDAPLAVFLSSGVDSALVSALIARELGKDVHTITVAVSPGSELDESADAKRIARHFGLSHEIVEGREFEEPLSAQAHLDLFCQPDDGVSAQSVRLLARSVKGRAKVVLSGMGGDELFFGYSKYAAAWKYRHLYALPRTILAPAQLFKNSFSAGQVLSDLIAIPGSQRYVAMKSFPTLPWLKRLPGFRQWASNYFGHGEKAEYLSFATHDLQRGMTDEHLCRYDLATMRESIELRTPFLNRALADLLAQFDPRSFVAFGQKNVLRSILSEYLPEAALRSKKRGFTYPPEAFVKAFGSTPPAPTGLEPALVREAWEKRFSSHGWTRLAVRLIAAHQFLTYPSPLTMTAR